MMYGSSDMERNGHNFLSFWTIFCIFTPLARKTKILEKGKTCLPTLSFYTCVHDIIIFHMMYRSWDVSTTEFFCHFGPFLAFYPPNLENQNFGKMKKNTWRYHHFTKMYHKWQSHDVRFLRYGERHIIFCHLLHSLLVH